MLSPLSTILVTDCASTSINSNAALYAYKNNRAYQKSIAGEKPNVSNAKEHFSFYNAAMLLSRSTLKLVYRSPIHTRYANITYRMTFYSPKSSQTSKHTNRVAVQSSRQLKRVLSTARLSKLL